MSNIVEIKNLSKNYNKKEVLKNINLNICTGILKLQHIVRII